MTGDGVRGNSRAGRVAGLTVQAWDGEVATLGFAHRGRGMACSASECDGGLLLAGMSRTWFRAVPDAARRWMADMNARAAVTVGPREGRGGRWRCFAAFHFPTLRGVTVPAVLDRAVECGMVAALFDEFAAARNL